MRVLIVEDDRSLAMALEYRLKKEGMEVESRADGVSALKTIESETFDMVLLDRMLPGMSGDALLTKLRDEGSAVPVLMLTAMDSVRDRVTGLDIGADDYLVKPFSMDELLARMRALSRRPAPWNPSGIISGGDLLLEIENMCLNCGELSVELSKRELRLIELLIRNIGQVLPRGLILQRVWPDNEVEDGNIDIYVHFLRKHLSKIHSRCQIHTMRGVGYRLEARA
ncbi:DNA-binding response regulator [Clostridia bacterium]|nr:DNA-binding response regulator [Clostridia bacterium]